MMNYEALNDIKEQISNDIKKIKVFSENIVETVSFSLNEIYKLYNYTQKFNEILKEVKKVIWEEVDEKVAEGFIKSLSFIFDETKKANPISYAVFYSMQYTFWQVVVVGGILADMKLSARLLSNSLSIFGKEKEEFVVDNNAPSEDIVIRFEKNDLLFALHDATMLVKAKKDKENKWNFEIEINDTYDFTDFKNIKEYADVEDVITDIFSTLLNNLGVVSSEYGVIKTYNLKIKFKTKEGEF